MEGQRKDSGRFSCTGTGFEATPSIPHRTLPIRGVVDYAHNDYIELLTDGGITGFLIVMWFVFTVLYILQDFSEETRALLYLSSSAALRAHLNPAAQCY
jgi:O-antigen ligase